MGKQHLPGRTGHLSVGFTPWRVFSSTRHFTIGNIKCGYEVILLGFCGWVPLIRVVGGRKHQPRRVIFYRTPAKAEGYTNQGVIINNIKDAF